MERSQKRQRRGKEGKKRKEEGRSGKQEERKDEKKEEEKGRKGIQRRIKREERKRKKQKGKQKKERDKLFAPPPEEFPGGNQLLHEARGGEVEEAATVGEMFVFFANHDGAEEGEGTLEFLELIAGHGVVGEVGVAVGHGEGSLADSLFVRHRSGYLGVGTDWSGVLWTGGMSDG